MLGKGGESLEKNKDESSYLAHLQPDSTQLLMTTIADALEVPRDIEWGPEVSLGLWSRRDGCQDYHSKWVIRVFAGQCIPGPLQV
jgi:hypothetical protein